MGLWPDKVIVKLYASMERELQQGQRAQRNGHNGAVLGAWL